MLVWHSNLTKENSLARFNIDNAVMAYFFGPLCILNVHILYSPSLFTM